MIQNQSDTSTAKKSKKSEKEGANTSASQSTPDSVSSKKNSMSKPDDATDNGTTAPSANAPAPKNPVTRQAPRANAAGMARVNTDTGIYHKPGNHWYGKTKKGKYMTEADAIKSGYHAAKKE